MRDPRPAGEASGKLLVELGGWFDHLAPAELQAVTSDGAVFVARRLAVVSGASVSDLVRLGGGRLVHANLGSSWAAAHVPDAVAERLTGSYALRFHDAGRRLAESDRRSLISAVWRSHPAPRIDLDHPRHDLHVYATEDGLWFGELLAACDPWLRHPHRRLFARSYEMPARKARVLVNLSGARPAKRFLDPFCGTGAIVLEAARIGCTAFGSDLDIRAASGAARNAGFDRSNAMFFAADARALPISRSTPVDNVASDLPYGRSAARRGTSGRDLYAALLAELHSVITTGGRAALMALSEDFARRPVDGWELDWSGEEHARTLVRSVAVWRRIG